MRASRTASLRRLWLNLHLWIAIGLGALLIPVSISGGLLVWHDEIDTLVNPQRYAVSGDTRLPASTYLTQAATAVASLGGDLQPTGVRYPDASGPVRVMTRGAPPAGGGFARIYTVYLDPPTGKVLDVVDFRASFFGFMHVFHENLTVPQYNGRQIVGWVGVGMLIMSLTGIWLWWPRGGKILRGLRWQRSPKFSNNLHHLFGFWISIPLAVVSFTGIYLSFPQTAREFMSAVAPMNPQAQRGGFGPVARQTSLTAERALDLALTATPGAKPQAVFVPVQQRGEQAAQGNPQAVGAPAGERGARAGGGLTWRVQLRTADDDIATVLVDDRSGSALKAPAPQSGDRAASWIRWIHEGSRGGWLWQTAVFLCGVLPTVFLVTGVMMWLRRRKARRLAEGLVSAEMSQLRPAE